MEELIVLPDVRPLRIGIASAFTGGGLGYWLLGQQRKAILMWVIMFVGGCCTFGLIYPLAIIAAYDAYLLAQKLEHGERIYKTQNAVPILDLIFR